MANTEIRKALQYVRDAETQVTTALQESGLTQAQRDLLDVLGDTLRDLDNHLVLDDLTTCAEDFEKNAQRIAELNHQTQEKLQELQDVADAVDKVAKALDGLVKVFGILAKAGLA